MLLNPIILLLVVGESREVEGRFDTEFNLHM